MKCFKIIAFVLELFLTVLNSHAEGSRLEVCSVQDTIVVEEARQTIYSFYKDCVTGAMPKKQLDAKYLTKALIERIERMGAEIDASPVFRAQDFDKHILETMTIEHLGGNWFMVRYVWNPGQEFESKSAIPMRVARRNNRYLIDYITPVWYGEQYGDHLLCDSLSIPSVSQADALSFVQSFFTVYTMTYASMPEGLAAKVADLRKKYITANALQQLIKAEKDYSEGWYDGYDLLIDGYDMDNRWYPSLTVKQLLLADTFRVKMLKYGKICTWEIKVVKVKDKFLIDSIQKLKTE